jgi:uncharacterized Zn-binding protein involved in type VI secretion
MQNKGTSQVGDRPLSIATIQKKAARLGDRAACFSERGTGVAYPSHSFTKVRVAHSGTALAGSEGEEFTANADMVTIAAWSQGRNLPKVACISVTHRKNLIMHGKLYSNWLWHGQETTRMLARQDSC